MPFDSFLGEYFCDACGEIADPACLLTAGVVCEDCLAKYSEPEIAEQIERLRRSQVDTVVVNSLPPKCCTTLTTNATDSFTEAWDGEW